MIEKLKKPEERRAFGKTLRNAAPLDSHAEWSPVADRPDPVALIEEQHESSPVYLRFPLLAKNIEIKNRVLKELCSLGLGASGSYPDAVADIAQLSPLFTDAESQ